MTQSIQYACFRNFIHGRKNNKIYNIFSYVPSKKSTNNILVSELLYTKEKITTIFCTLPVQPHIINLYIQYICNPKKNLCSYTNVQDCREKMERIRVSMKCMWVNEWKITNTSLYINEGQGFKTSKVRWKVINVVLHTLIKHN